MSKLDLPIIWKGEIVGIISDLKSDNFDVYGKWVPSDCPSAKEFLNEVESVGEAVVRIGLGEPKWIGTVEMVPAETIEIKSRPNLSDF